MSKFLVVLALASGCSIALQSKPKSASCSTTPVFWIADSVGVAASVAALAVGLIVPRYTEAAAPAAITSVAYLASAHNGYKWAGQCRARTESIAAR